MSETMKQYIDEAEAALLHTYNRYQVVVIVSNYVFSKILIFKKKGSKT